MNPDETPLTDEMKAKVLSIFKPPFSFSIGNIYDCTGRIVADHYTDDEPGALIRMRGWGRLTGKGGGMGLSSDEAYEIQCAAGQMFAEAFNAYWGTPTPSASVPVERLEALKERLEKAGKFHDGIADEAEAAGRDGFYHEGFKDGFEASASLLSELIEESRK